MLKRKKISNTSILLRLWGSMMMLIAIAVAFIWIVQIFLFEQNYVDAAVSAVEDRLDPITRELATTDLSINRELAKYVSKTVNGKMIVMDAAGTVFMAYSNSHPIEIDEYEGYAAYLMKSDVYTAITQNEIYRNLINADPSYILYETAIPIIWQGHPALIYLTHSIEEVYTVQAFNRQQLITLSILLTVLSGLIAWILSKQFIKPIFQIKAHVEQMAKNDLTPKQALNRTDELGQLSGAVVALNTALQRVDVLRKEVIANVSHELRAPLSLIIGYGEMVRDVSHCDEKLRDEHLNLIIGEARRMSTMVDDIMDYSQFQAGYIQLNKEHYNLYDIVESEVEFCRQTVADYGINIEFESFAQEIPVCLDALKISQVLRNLLNNAVNHTGDNQTILVHITQGQIKNEPPDTIKVTVSNPGSPIPEEKMAMIWERYYSSQHKGSRKQGTGIGLSIVSTILDAHGYIYGVCWQTGYNHFWFQITRKQE